MRTNPNQKVVTVDKEICDTEHLYAKINLAAMEKAAQDLDAGPFKLWIYFAKNQNNYTFALSNKDAKETFGMGIKQYNTAVEKLVEKGYLVAEEGSNHYIFHEVVVTKGNNENAEKNSVVTKGNNDVLTKGNNPLLQKEIRNITYTTTEDITGQTSHSRSKSLEFKF